MTVQKIIAQNYQLFSGDTAVFKVTVKNQADQAQDITGATALFTIARRPEDTPVVQLTTGTGITIDDAVTGKVTITVPSTDTDPLHGAYRWELQMTDAVGRVSTVAFGTVSFIIDAG